MRGLCGGWLLHLLRRSALRRSGFGCRLRLFRLLDDRNGLAAATKRAEVAAALSLADRWAALLEVEVSVARRDELRVNRIDDPLPERNLYPAILGVVFLQQRQSHLDLDGVAASCARGGKVLTRGISPKERIREGVIVGGDTLIRINENPDPRRAAIQHRGRPRS